MSSNPLRRNAAELRPLASPIGTPVLRRCLRPILWSTRWGAAHALQHDGVLSEKLTYIFPERSRPNLLTLAAYEKNAWMFMVWCVAGQEPPADLVPMIATVTEETPV